MMNDTTAMLNLLATLGSIIAMAVGIAMWINHKFAQAAEARAATEKRIEKHVTEQIEKMRGEVGEVERALGRHKLHAAETFATKADVSAGLSEIKIALEKLDGKLDRLGTARTAGRPRQGQ